MDTHPYLKNFEYTCRTCGERCDITGLCDYCWETEVAIERLAKIAKRNRKVALRLLEVVVDSGVLSDYRLAGDEPVIVNRIGIFQQIADLD